MSDKRKKKTVPKREVNPNYRESRFSIDPNFMGRYSGYGRNIIDDALDSEDAQMAGDFKRKRLEEANLKRDLKIAETQRKLDKLKREGGGTDSDSSDIPQMSVAMMKEIAELPPNERDKVIETYAIFRSMNQSKGKGNSLLPLLVGFSRTNPGSSQNDMAAYAKAFTDSFKTGIDVMKSVAPPQDKPSNVVEFMKVMKDLVISGVRDPLIQAMKDNQPQPGILEQFITNPDLFSRVKELGLFGRREPTTGSTNIDLEIEKLKGDRQLEITKLNLEMRKAILEIDAKERRSDTMLSMLAPFTVLLATPIAQRMQQLGAQQGAAYRPTDGVPTVMPPTGSTVVIRCSGPEGCGYEGSETFPGPLPKIINCPQCGIGLNINVGRIPDEKPGGTGRDT